MTAKKQIDQSKGILHALGLEQFQLWYLHNGRQEKLTDFGGTVIKEVFA